MKIVTTVTIDESHLDEIENRRGLVKRSTYTNYVIGLGLKEAAKIDNG